MLLASVTEIVSSLGFDSMPDINAAVTAALHSADAILSARLDCDFALKTSTDFFFVQAPVTSNGLFNETHFRLKNSLVVTGTVVLTYATSKAALTTDGTVVATDDLVIDLASGAIIDTATPYTNQFVSITYQSGFTATSETAFDLDEVPDWLERAARTQALVELAEHPVLKQASVTLDAKTLKHELDAILSKRRRYMPLALAAL